MSETPQETPATEAETPPETPAETKPTETVDFWKAKAREQEKRAKENAEAAKRLSEIEESNKTEVQKAADRITSLEREVSTAKAEALRFKIAAKFNVTDEDADLFLTGTDEETLTKQAERLQARAEEAGKPGKPKPDPRQGRGTDTPTSLDPRAADLAQIESDLAASRR